ncbi:hypothetical protein D0859_13353 [Hortaea werneckii]|uniref:Uncharacterized protein n=1 Tax=Hortaea werneckii TaxID=91943 RepID=A0A3M7IAJ6_HORWE|nr:hypothetical protein D0859_13353 [Hortaea werneckii]
MDKVIRPSRAFCLKGEVAVVSGAGSRMRDRCMRDWKWPSNSNTVSAAIAQVVLVDFNEQWASDTKEMIDAEGGESVVVQADVTDESSVQIAVAKAVKTYGKIDILVNIGKLTSF